MEKNQTDRLREHMRDRLAEASAVDSAEGILDSRRPPNSAKNPGEAALDLVYQAAEIIGDVENSAAEKQARAEKLAKQAIGKVRIADARVRSAESGRLAAEAKTKEFSDRLQEAEEAMEQMASRVAAAEAQLSTAEQQARTAELRANEAKDALNRIEEAIRTQVLGKIPGNFRRAGMAA